MFHNDVYACFIFYRVQYATIASLDATLTTGATAFNNTDDLVPVFVFSIHVERHPQKDGGSHSYIYNIHFLLFYMILYLCRQMNVENILWGVKIFIPISR
jgi:hypothetical protein